MSCRALGFGLWDPQCGQVGQASDSDLNGHGLQQVQVQVAMAAEWDSNGIARRGVCIQTVSACPVSCDMCTNRRIAGAGGLSDGGHGGDADVGEACGKQDQYRQQRIVSAQVVCNRYGRRWREFSSCSSQWRDANLIGTRMRTSIQARDMMTC